MNMESKTVVTIETTVDASLEKVWNNWTDPAHIVNWNAASPDWHTPRASNDLKVGGELFCRMEARDGSFGFDLKGIYTAVEPLKKLDYVFEDDRKVGVAFSDMNGKTLVVQHFEAETQNPVEFQKAGWQAILDNFKNYTENN
ncbi:MAG TPA: SRPBCC domain-containing protein [Fluviicola sp.]|nr:SRPBCC domain-containing protein [Fluviicola sp.]